MNILIIKPDHIGDYIVFRKFIQQIKDIKHLKNCTITCILNQRVKDLAEFLDNFIVDNFIFIELEKYILGEWYFERQNSKLNKNQYDIIINAMLSHFDPLENFISTIKANKKYMLYEQMYDETKYFLNTYGHQYHNIINVSNIEFEIDKFAFAFEQIFEHKIPILSPTISLPQDPHLKINHKNKYILIFIGSDAKYRKWNIQKYCKIIEFILQTTHLDVILSGSTQELEEAMIIEDKIHNKRFYNLVNQTSLVDMLYLVNESELILSNETGIAHIAVALNKTTLVVSNGNHLGKFTPYPEKYTDKYFSIYPFNIDTKEDFEKYIKLYYSKSDLDINTITVSSVLNKLKNILTILNLPYTDYVIDEMQPDLYRLSPSQIKLNYEFSSSFSKMYTEINKLKNSNKKFLIYGQGSFGKVLKSILDNSFIDFIDKDDKKLSSKLSSKNYDYIIISVLGREDIIESFLFNNHNVPMNKLVKIKIVKGKYSVRTK